MSKQLDWPYVINLGNSIIGVSVLAMPFCFKQCGILLGVLLLISSAWLTTLTCDLLMKGAYAAKKRSYEFLALHVFGPGGKFTVELCIIGLLLGSCVAFHVVIGDLGPAIVSRILGVENTSSLRMCIMVFLGMFVALPVGMLRNVESLANISAMSLAFYMIFITEIFTAAFPNLWSGVWISKVKIWEPNGIFKCLPIFSLAFGCQSQLFIMYDAMPDPSLKRINKISRSAVSMCTLVYLLVGYFGYVAFCDEDVSGDILMNFRPTWFAEIIKLGFVLSVAVSFPLVIFPCRAALHTLLCTKADHQMQVKGTHDNFGGAPMIPDLHFKLITVSIVVGTLITGICIPNIEFVLALTGATTGSLICYIFPAMLFLHVLSGNSSSGKITAQFILFVGVTILLASTYTTLYSDQGNQAVDPKVKIAPPPAIEHAEVLKAKLEEVVNVNIDSKIKDAKKDGGGVVDPGGGGGDVKKSVKEADDVVPEAGEVVADSDKRQEPPNPHAPDDQPVVPKDSVVEYVKKKEDKGTVSKTTPKPKSEKKAEGDTKKEGADGAEAKEVEQAAKVKEEELKKKEVELDLKIKDADAAKKAAESEAKQLLTELEIQRQEQKQLIEEQKEIIQELKQHQQDAHKTAPLVEAKQPEEVAKDIVEDKEQIKQQKAQQILQGEGANVPQQDELREMQPQKAQPIVPGDSANVPQQNGPRETQPQERQQRLLPQAQGEVPQAAAAQPGDEVGQRNLDTQGNVVAPGGNAGLVKNAGVPGQPPEPPVQGGQGPVQGGQGAVQPRDPRLPGNREIKLPDSVRQQGNAPQILLQQENRKIPLQPEIVRQSDPQQLVVQQSQQGVQQQRAGQQQNAQQPQQNPEQPPVELAAVPRQQALDEPQASDQHNRNSQNTALRNPGLNAAAAGDTDKVGVGMMQGNDDNDNLQANDGVIGHRQKRRTLGEEDPWQENNNDQFVMEPAEKLLMLGAAKQNDMAEVLNNNVHNAVRASRKR